jgi:hypothetical protein
MELMIARPTDFATNHTFRRTIARMQFFDGDMLAVFAQHFQNCGE